MNKPDHGLLHAQKMQDPHLDDTVFLVTFRQLLLVFYTGAGFGAAMLVIGVLLGRTLQA